MYICVVKRCDLLKRAYMPGISGSGRTLAGGGSPGGGGGGTDPGGGGTLPGGGGGTEPGGGGMPGGWAYADAYLCCIGSRRWRRAERGRRKRTAPSARRGRPCRATARRGRSCRGSASAAAAAFLVLIDPSPGRPEPWTVLISHHLCSPGRRRRPRRRPARTARRRPHHLNGRRRGGSWRRARDRPCYVVVVGPQKLHTPPDASPGLSTQNLHQVESRAVPGAGVAVARPGPSLDPHLGRITRPYCPL
jgi:hypothetical protein